MGSPSRAPGSVAAAAASPPRPVNLRQYPAGGDGEGTTAAAVASGFLAVKRGRLSLRRRQADSTRCRETATVDRVSKGRNCEFRAGAAVTSALSPGLRGHCLCEGLTAGKPRRPFRCSVPRYRSTFTSWAEKARERVEARKGALPGLSPTQPSASPPPPRAGRTRESVTPVTSRPASPPSSLWAERRPLWPSGGRAAVDAAARRARAPPGPGCGGGRGGGRAAGGLVGSPRWLPPLHTRGAGPPPRRPRGTRPLPGAARPRLRRVLRPQALRAWGSL